MKLMQKREKGNRGGPEEPWARKERRAKEDKRTTHNISSKKTE
jgi:hypothetical protein